MGVRCGYCGYNHDDAAEVRACSEDDMFRRRHPSAHAQLHPRNRAAWRYHDEAAERAARAEKEAPRDDERNLRGLAEARRALRGPHMASAAR